VFELERDAFRALAYIDDRHCQLISRRNLIVSSEFDNLKALLEKLGMKLRWAASLSVWIPLAGASSNGAVGCAMRICNCAWGFRLAGCSERWNQKSQQDSIASYLLIAVAYVLAPT
jgi:hypothetical protein